MDIWHEVSLQAPEALSEVISSVLFDLGATGVQEEDPLPSHVHLKAWFLPDNDATELLERLRAAILELGIEQGDKKSISESAFVERLPDQAWNEIWRSEFSPISATPRILICPPWDLLPPPPDGFILNIEPKQAFGTGHHESTRLALSQLEKILRPGCSVCDVGSGSGILALAAAKLEAGSVLAIDNDPICEEIARENVMLNEVSDRVTVRTGSLHDTDATFDIIVANIMSGILTPMLPDFRARAGRDGRVILGGILLEERESFLSTLAKEGFEVLEERKDGEWMGLVCQVQGSEEEK